MAVISLTDCFYYHGGYDATTQANAGTLNLDVAELDATTFGSNGWREVSGGLKKVDLAYSGFWDITTDGQSFVNLDLAAQACTIGPTESDASTGVYMFRATRTQYTQGGQIGELAPFSIAATGSGQGTGAVRGRLAKAKGNVSATGALGSALNLGAVASDKFLYATFHVFSPGTTITVQVQSDDNSGFTTPTTVATIGPVTTGGATWMTPVAGALTDTWFRFNVSAITGTFSVAGAIAIGS